MNVILHMIDELHEPIQLVALTALLCWIGGYMLAGRNDLLVWSYRLAGLFFCAYNAYGIWNFAPDSPGQFLGIEIRALIAAFLARGIFGIVLAVWGFVVRGPTATLERWQQSAREKAARERAEQERAEKIRREREEYERAAPDRERARKAAEAHAREKLIAQRRREDARISCEIFYNLYELELAKRFPPSAFDHFLSIYLGDEHSAEYVEGRAAQLQQLIQQHVEKLDLKPKKRLQSMAEITAWYEAQLAQIQAIQDERLKGVMTSKLKARFADLSLQILEERGE